MKTIGVLKEQNGDPRVALIPQTVKKIISELKFTVFVEENAGEKAGFTNEDYLEAGADILTRNDIIKLLDIFLCIHPFVPPFSFDSSKMIVGVFNPLFFPKRIEAWKDQPVDLFSLDMVPRTTKAQAMDVLSSQASLAGYKAVIKGADLYSSVLPMFTTAAGTVRPAKVLILGAGVAGLQAIATAKRLGAIVEAFDVRKAAGEEVRSLGATFIEVEGAIESQQAGGYALEQTEEYLEKQRLLIDKHVSEASIVISTANIPGRKAPRLIENASVEKMKPGSVIVDLASEQGGNCALTVDNDIIRHKGVTIIGNAHLSREVSFTASQLLSANYFHFLKHWKQTTEKGILNDPILEGAQILQQGEIINERFQAFCSVE